MRRGAKQATPQLRVIGGQWRGRKLQFPDRPGLRPTADRVRETLFNWLGPHLQAAKCLDLFAGSGALGIEALSRGAAHCDFVDADREAVTAVGHHHPLEKLRGALYQIDRPLVMGSKVPGYTTVWVNTRYILQ